MATVMNKTAYLFIICIIASLGGLLFGLDQGFIDGSLHFISQELHLTLSQSESFASILLAGAVIGALMSGFVSHTFGRKKTLMLTAAAFAVFSYLSSRVTSYDVLYTYRFILGLAVGVASFTVPLYLSEIAPKRFRGGFVAMYQQLLTVGIFVIYVSNTLIGNHYHSWRPMLYVIAIPGLIMFLGAFIILESPRWLMLKKQQNKAKSVLEKVCNRPQDIQEQLSEINTTLQKDGRSTWHNLKLKPFWKVLILGILVQVFQQLAGINAIIYYSSSIFHSAGLTNPATATIVIGLVNMLSTLLPVLFLDKFGRKPIMYTGLILMTITLCINAWCFMHGHNHTWLNNVLLGSVLIYIFAFAISFGPIAWVICAEIFPLSGRDLGLTVTTCANWISAFLVVRFSLSIIQNYGGATLFLIFAVCCVLAIGLMYFFTPETNGISLEVLEQRLMANKRLKDIGQ